MFYLRLDQDQNTVFGQVSKREVWWNPNIDYISITTISTMKYGGGSIMLGTHISSSELK